MSNISGVKINLNIDVEMALARLANEMGVGVQSLSFSFSVDDGKTKLNPSNLNMCFNQSADGSYVFTGKWQDVQVRWIFTPVNEGYTVQLKISRDKPLNCWKLDTLIFEYSP